MTIYDLVDKEGRVFAFEVENAHFNRKEVCDFVQTIPGAKLLKAPKFLSEIREEVFCEFQIEGRKFIVWEPFGDNSRYWVGPEPTDWCKQLAPVKNAFANYKESFVK